MQQKLRRYTCRSGADLSRKNREAQRANLKRLKPSTSGSTCSCFLLTGKTTEFNDGFHFCYTSIPGNFIDLSRSNVYAVTMPKIYEYLGFIFFFYSSEHLPVHCHVKKGDREIKVELKYSDRKLEVKFIKVKGKTKFEGNDLGIIEWFTRKHHLRIVEKWTAYFIYGKSPNFEKIKTKK